ncbi:hypothetical protein ABC347_03100 [Sphingomonas sp. 1P06PA]|uniref:hypothetical protein n=1 Tax=Sphingomonas sp. 1P06PA TaxID=554121 RepID=UPI0039A4D194
MSRALNINMAQADVVALCAKRKVGISAIESLTSGGTRVVMHNAADADVIAKAYGAKVIAGPVRRTPTRLLRQ